MTSLIHRIEQLIKSEKTTPERKKKEEPSKSSSEILSELFGAFNADPPKIEDMPSKKTKKSKKRHRKDKKKRSRSSSSDDSSNSDCSRRRKKRKTKSKKRRSRSKSYEQTHSPRSTTPTIKPDPNSIKSEKTPIKTEVKTETIKNEPPTVVKSEDSTNFMNIDASLIPLPDSPSLKETCDSKIAEISDSANEHDKNKGKIQIKNLKFSAVFEETVKKAEEEARKKAEKYEEGEYTDSSNSSVQEIPSNSQFPKASDLEEIVKKKDSEQTTNSKSKNSSHKSSKRNSSRSRRRSRSKSSRRRSRSHSTSRKHRHSSKSKRRSHSRHRSSSRHRRRSRSRSRHRGRHLSPRHRSRRSRSRARSGSKSRVKLAESEKKRLLEVARRNAINMLRSGAVPAGAALPPHTRSHVMAAIQSGGKSVDELTDFCKHLSKKEALGELSSVSSHDGDSENEDTLAFHHPFLVKDKTPIVMNIRGGAPLPVKNSIMPIANKEELRLQFPVSSGSQHRDSEWVPVSPKRDNMQVAKLNSEKPIHKSTAIANTPKEPLALPAPPAAPPAPALPQPTTFVQGFTPGSQLSSVSTVPALPAPGPQAYPPGVEPTKLDMAQLVSQKLSMIRKEQEECEISSFHGFGWSKQNKSSLGQFTGSTGANILTPRELASGTQAWAKKDQLVRAAPVAGGMGMHLLQKMGWTPGRGLGKEGTGTLQPLLLEVKLDTKGLQAKEEGPNRQKMRVARKTPAGNFLNANGKHPVSLLGEYCSKGKFGPPEYTLCFECGPDHKKNFLFRVKVAGVEYQPAVASANKKQAKADAAQLALQKLGILP